MLHHVTVLEAVEAIDVVESDRNGVGLCFGSGVDVQATGIAEVLMGVGRVGSASLPDRTSIFAGVGNDASGIASSGLEEAFSSASWDSSS